MCSSQFSWNRWWILNVHLQHCGRCWNNFFFINWGQWYLSTIKWGRLKRIMVKMVRTEHYTEQELNKYLGNEWISGLALLLSKLHSFLILLNKSGPDESRVMSSGTDTSLEKSASELRLSDLNPGSNMSQLCTWGYFTLYPLLSSPINKNTTKPTW